MSKSSEAVKRCRNRAKERLVHGFGGKCGICGYNKTMNALGLHHIDPSEKEFSFGRIRANCVNWGEVAREASKCVLLCSNCHREVHAGLVDNDIIERLPKFNDERSKEIKLNKELFYCECGKEKKKNSKFCSNLCFERHKNIFGVKVNWNDINLDELSKTMSNGDIGDMLGVTEAAVRKRKAKLKSMTNNVIPV